MPEYLAPGVYVEETSFRAKSIEGVSTTTTGFIGPTRYGPVDLEPDVITSLGEFERVYGDRTQLKFTFVDESNAETKLPPAHNYMWHAVRAFFENDGKRLYIVRAFRPISDTNDGYAKAVFPQGSPPEDRIKIRARFPGEAGRMRVRLTLRLGQNVLRGEPDKPSVSSLLDGDVVWISDLPGSPPSPPSSESGEFYVANKILDPTTGGTTWEFTNLLTSPPSSPTSKRALSTLRPDPDPRLSDKVRVVTLTVTTMLLGESDLPPAVWSGLALDPSHKTAGQPDSIFDKFAARPSNLSEARRLPIVIERGEDGAGKTNITDGIEVLERLFIQKPSLRASLDDPGSTDDDRSIDFLLDGGNDGQRPTANEYEGEAKDDSPLKTGLKAFEDIEDISIVAAPGSTYGYENGYRKQAATIISLLITHCERMRYRIAVLDSGDGQTIADVRALRSRYDSNYAALYYPWVKILDPVTQNEIVLPPSGFITGIYARNDIQRAVYKAPANEVVNLALGFEQTLNKAQQEVLNPEGVNCLRFFEGRGFRVWGARTISSDPEWKYVNLRRYFAYLERSIDRGTQWAVFEPNGENLWANVRRTIETFLLNEFQMGALLGDRPEKAFFVRCDRTTMTQNDLDNGRLVCLIGVSPLRPAEFVIFRIGQWTADRK
jgi:phage tail sheath protein FI